MPEQRLPLLVGTRNAGKLRELISLFAGIGVELVDLERAGVPRSAEEDAVETFDSFEANALAKARYYHAASGGLPTVADDSGLEVLALGGRPGVRSRRYAGVEGPSPLVDRANNARLVEELTGSEDRRSRFVCAVALVDGAGELVVRGEATGQLLEAPRGTHGFGYDPLFLSDDLGVTFAEAGEAAKARVSHRARAFAALAARLAEAPRPWQAP